MSLFGLAIDLFTEPFNGLTLCGDKSSDDLEESLCFEVTALLILSVEKRGVFNDYRVRLAGSTIVIASEHKPRCCFSSQFAGLHRAVC